MSASFQKISFQLTPEQREALEPFTGKVTAGALLPDKDTRYAVMGNVWLSETDGRAGTVDVYLIPAKEYHIINNAIQEAKKLK